MENTCFICQKKAQLEESLNVISCTCPHCGTYAYEKNFLTTYEYYFSVNSSDRCQKISNFLKKYVKNHHVCFVDDFETSLVTGYDLLEFRDILNMCGLEVTHNNTIDSNWKD